jgi:hypothetical protein
MSEGLSPRHVKLLGIFAMIVFMLIGAGAYLLVAFYFKHTWSLIFIVTFLFLGFLSPAVCYGYDSLGDPLADFGDGPRTPESRMNCRDLGYVLCGIFALLTYVVISVAWIASDGVNPTWVATVVVYVGNTNFVYAFACWLRIFLFVK